MRVASVFAMLAFALGPSGASWAAPQTPSPVPEPLALPVALEAPETPPSAPEPPASPVAPETPPVASKPTLLVEPLSEEWRERLLGPMLARLASLGQREVVEAEPGTALARIAAEPDSIAIMRRSQLAAATVDARIEHLELGPATCLALVARAGLPYSSYAELNYTGDGQPLRIVFASENARDLFDRVRERFPLGSMVEREERPAIIGLQRLGTGEADLLVLDVPRQSRSMVPAEKLAAALGKDHRLLSLPAALPAPGMGLLPGKVQLDDPPFWREAETYETFCDPFVLAIRHDAADRLVHRLYTAEPAGPAETSFVDQALAAARGLGTIIATRLPL
jgi:hypothetical protein